MEMIGQLHVPAALPPDEEPLLFIRKGAVWIQTAYPLRRSTG
jgi:hypothetical protein